MLSSVREFVFPHECLDGARKHLWKAGRHGHEAFVVFAGHVSGTSAFVRHVLYPKQEPLVHLPYVGVHVGGRSIFELSRWAALHSLVLLGQMHSHPSDAFHSVTDATYPLVSLPGAFSVVVPDFCRSAIRLEACACYRCVGGKWELVPAPQLFRVV